MGCVGGHFSLKQYIFWFCSVSFDSEFSSDEESYEFELDSSSVVSSYFNSFVAVQSTHVPSGEMYWELHFLQYPLIGWEFVSSSSQEETHLLGR